MRVSDVCARVRVCVCAIRMALNTAFLQVTRGFYGICYQDGVFDGVLYVNVIHL